MPNILVASYGGSGSTFLTSALEKASVVRGVIRHVHAAPDNFLGIPVFNRFTGHSEGPFSRKHELPESFKTVFIYRDPARAIRSRGCFKHFMHLWSETEVVSQLFGKSAPSTEGFRALWAKSKRAGEDIFRLEQYFKQWEDYAAKQRHDIAFVKYEELKTHWEALLSWLDLPTQALKGFESVNRELSPEDERPYRALKALQAERPGFQVFDSTRTPDSPAAQLNLRSEKAPERVFRIVPPRAGASDAMSRVALAYDILCHTGSDPIHLAEYQNYHSPNADFFALFNVDKVPRVILAGQKPNITPALTLTTTELVFFLLYDPTELEREGTIEILANEYPHAQAAQNFRRWFHLDSTFQSALSYSPGPNPFSGQTGVNVVIHLRRGDVSGDALFRSKKRSWWFGAKAPRIPQKGMHSRPLLDLHDVIRDLKKRVAKGHSCNTVIVSDGFDRQRRQYWANPHVLRRIEELQNDLYAAPKASGLQLNHLETIVGDSDDNTRRTLDALFFADLVYTASSSFVSLISNLSDWHGTVLDLVRGKIVRKDAKPAPRA